MYSFDNYSYEILNEYLNKSNFLYRNYQFKNKTFMNTF